jgi:hypothetical protein
LNGNKTQLKNMVFLKLDNPLKLSHCPVENWSPSGIVTLIDPAFTKKLSFSRFRTVNGPIDFRNFLGNGPIADVVRRAREAQPTIRGSAVRPPAAPLRWETMPRIICMEQAVIVKVQRMYCQKGRGDPSRLELRCLKWRQERFWEEWQGVQKRTGQSCCGEKGVK